MIIKRHSHVFREDFFLKKTKIAVLHVNNDRTRGCQSFYALFGEAQMRQHAQIDDRKKFKNLQKLYFFVRAIFIVWKKVVLGTYKIQSIAPDAGK